MAAAFAAGTGVATPDVAWKTLESDAGALLVDVRTRAEWAFVGAPDLTDAAADAAFVEWTQFPTGAPNPSFTEDVAAAVREAGAATVFFICRSGARPQAAATAMQAHFDAVGEAVACVNVAEGFEGDLDAEGRRARRNGWKARSLPWRQT